MASLFCCKCATACVIDDSDGVEREKCPKCGYTYYRNPFPCVSVIVCDGANIALGKRSDSSIYPGKWCLPCGYIEYNESFLEASIREVKEEIGIIVNPIKVVNVVSNQLAHGINSVVVVILAEPTTHDLSANDDLVEAGWFNLTRPLPELAFDADKYIIEKYAQCLGNGTEIPGILLSDRQFSFNQE